MHRRQLNFWTNYLLTTSLFLMLLGIFWAIAGTFDPFKIYETYFAQHFYSQTVLPTDAKTAYNFLLGPFGATSAAYFLMQFLIIKNTFHRRELWAYKTILAAFVFWFVLDTSICIYYGAYFNIILANISSLLLMSPILFLRKYFNKY